MCSFRFWISPRFVTKLYTASAHIPIAKVKADVPSRMLKPCIVSAYILVVILSENMTFTWNSFVTYVLTHVQAVFFLLLFGL
jgi:hypothetical protein